MQFTAVKVQHILFMFNALGFVSMKTTLSHSDADFKKMVIGIGASAGGLDSLQLLFSSLPDDSGASFVIIQHLSPDFKSHMGEVLSKFTNMKIETVVQRATIEPNTIYLLHPGKEMILSGGILIAQERDSIVNMPINHFFRSMAKDAGPDCIAVVLSGTGTDGSEGIRSVNDAGGLVIVQSPESSKFDGMPQTAISTGIVDHVLDPAEIGDEIIRHMSGSETGAVSEASSEMSIQDILLLLHKESDIDFSMYKQATISRRIQRRLKMLHIADEREYLDLLSMEPAELDLLFHDILIGVTGFFRDSRAFKSLYDEFIKPLVADSSNRDEIRVWVPACATGEEAYTISILFFEAFNELGIQPNLKIFASDIHKRSLDIASNGVYSNVDGVSDKYLQKYFITNDEGVYQVNAKLRQSVVFVKHDVINNPPFTKMDLVSCRNLFIYLKPNVQQRILASFIFSLKPGACLMLGPSEAIGEMGKEYEEMDSQWRLFRKPHGMAKVPRSVMALMVPSLMYKDRDVKPVRQSSKPDSKILEGYDMLLSAFISPGVLVDGDLRIIHLFGKVGEIIHQKSGRLIDDISSMVNRELSLAINSGISKAKKNGRKIKVNGIKTGDDGDSTVDITILPLSRPSGGEFYFISMDKASENKASPAESMEISEGTQDRLLQLEAELQDAKEVLETTVEELEARNEELISANEEMQSTNEELNSVVEELNSVNTVNSEQIETLTNLTNDLNNLMKATEVGAVFIGKDMLIKNFTPRVRSIFNIIETDIGRPFNHLTHNLPDNSFLKNIQEVMGTGGKAEREITINNENRYLERSFPYYDDSNKISGAVLSYIDITQLKLSEIKFRLLFDQSPIAIGFMDEEGRMIRMNPAMEKILAEPDKVRDGKPIFDYALMPEDCRVNMMKGSNSYFEVEVEPGNEMFDEGANISWVSFNISPVTTELVSDDGYMVIIQDISYEKDAESRMKDSLDEKILMLQEVHHRVKNNLATVNSLLAMQSSNVVDPSVKNCLKEAESRIFVLSSIHEELYRSESLFNISASKFFNRLMENITDLYDIDVTAEIEIDEGLELNDRLAIPLGLAVNEMIVNSMMHAFKDTQDPVIHLSMKLDDGCLKILLKDNGCGVPDCSKIGGSGSLGTRLIERLITIQLKGKMEHRNENGLLWDIQIPL